MWSIGIMQNLLDSYKYDGGACQWQCLEILFLALKNYLFIHIFPDQANDKCKKMQSFASTSLSLKNDHHHIVRNQNQLGMYYRDFTSSYLHEVDVIDTFLVNRFFFKKAGRNALIALLFEEFSEDVDVHQIVYVWRLSLTTDNNYIKTKTFLR